MVMSFKTRRHSPRKFIGALRRLRSIGFAVVKHQFVRSSSRRTQFDIHRSILYVAMSTSCLKRSEARTAEKTDFHAI